MPAPRRRRIVCGLRRRSAAAPRRLARLELPGEVRVRISRGSITSRMLALANRAASMLVVGEHARAPTVAVGCVFASSRSPTGRSAPSRRLLGSRAACRSGGRSGRRPASRRSRHGRRRLGAAPCPLRRREDLVQGLRPGHARRRRRASRPTAERKEALLERAVDASASRATSRRAARRQTQRRQPARAHAAADEPSRRAAVLPAIVAAAAPRRRPRTSARAERQRRRALLVWGTAATAWHSTCAARKAAPFRDALAHRRRRDATAIAPIQLRRRRARCARRRCTTRRTAIGRERLRSRSDIECSGSFSSRRS